MTCLFECLQHDPHHYIQEVGVSVDLVCFEDAEHVKLYTKYPQKYVQSVCKFINDCLSNSEQIGSSNKKAD